MDGPAKQIAVVPGKMVEGLCATLASVAGSGAEMALATRRKLLARLSQRANKQHCDHVAHILMAGQGVPGYEEAFENLEDMTEAAALEVFVCMARRSARLARAYQTGDDPFGEVHKFLDRMAADRMAGQKRDLFHRLAREAIDEREAARAFSRNRHRATQGRDRHASPLLGFFGRTAVHSEIPSRRWDSR